MKLCHVISIALAGAILLTGPPRAFAGPGGLQGSYYILPGWHPDTNTGIDFSIVTGLVQNTLGPGGLPVATPKAINGTGFSSGPFTNLNANYEILWWVAGQSGIVLEKVQNDLVPINQPTDFFPDGFTSNPPFRSVHWQGFFYAPDDGTASFSLKADDDAWLFVNGSLALDDGGVKPMHTTSAVVSNLVGLTPGSLYTVDLFFADRHIRQSGIEFTSSVQLYPIPEPAFFQMGALVAMSGLGLLRSRRSRNR